MTDETSLVDFEVHGPITVGKIVNTNVLDGMNVSDFGNGVLDYVQEHAGVKLLLNFEQVTYMSSAALTELLKINEALRESQGAVRLCNLSCEIQKVFKITNLEKLFVIHDDENVDSARKRFERSLAVAAEEDAWAGGDAAP